MEISRDPQTFARGPDEEFLRDDFLSSNEFEKSLLFKEWAETDREELAEIEMMLTRIEAIDGPPTEKELSEVQMRLNELEARVPETKQ